MLGYESDLEICFRFNHLKIYIFVQHIYNFLQSIHRLHVSALLGHHQALHMNRFL